MHQKIITMCMRLYYSGQNILCKFSNTFNMIGLSLSEQYIVPSQSNLNQRPEKHKWEKPLSIQQPLHVMVFNEKNKNKYALYICMFVRFLLCVPLLLKS